MHELHIFVCDFVYALCVPLRKKYVCMRVCSAMYKLYNIYPTYGETRILGTSAPSSPAMALLATLAIHCMARVV